jgi:hypothetical protein
MRHWRRWLSAMTSHAPEVLRDLCDRLRRESRPRQSPGVAGDVVHEMPREDLVLAYNGRILELDRVCTFGLDPSAVLPP